jgi:hypothetical protein
MVHEQDVGIKPIPSRWKNALVLMKQPDQPSRPEAIRRLIRQALAPSKC